RTVTHLCLSWIPVIFFLYSSAAHRDLHSFPTRRSSDLVAMLLASGLCSNPLPMTAAVDASGSQSARVGDSVQLVVKVTNTGPLIPHLGLVFRTTDRWYERHKVTDLSGCVIARDESAFDCGDLGKDE